MIIKDIKRDLFDKLDGRILILCALDVDALCGCKILQSLLETFNLQYSVAPVGTVENLIRSFEEYRNSIDSVITINFGNLINIPKLLKPADTLNFYVIDSHRPINVYNYYKNPQVKLLINRDEKELKIPPEAKIFLKNDSGLDDENEDENLALLTADARDLTDEQLDKRRELKRWLIQKQNLMFEYEEFNYYNRSVSSILYDLANLTSKNNNYLLWLNILGLSSQLKSDKISQESFEEEAKNVIRYISRNKVSKNYSKGNDWSLSYQKDIQMDLYRKWTVFESLSNTPLTVCKLHLFTDKGRRNLLEFLVECGLKLTQVKNPYVCMDRDWRNNMLDGMSQVCLGDSQYKYNLQDLITRSFVLDCGVKNVYAANDILLAARAIIDTHDSEQSVKTKFVRAIQSLSYDDWKLSQGKFEPATKQLKSMFDNVTILITTMKVEDMGVFLHVDLQHHKISTFEFARGESLMAFAKFLLNAYVSSKPTRIAKRAVRLPLILFAPDLIDTNQTIVIGIPPVAQEAKKNFFGKAFEQAAEYIECEIKPDLSEPNLIRVNADHKHLLLEQIKALME